MSDVTKIQNWINILINMTVDDLDIISDAIDIVKDKKKNVD
jgi:hypothetical protein